MDQTERAIQTGYMQKQAVGGYAQRQADVVAGPGRPSSPQLSESLGVMFESVKKLNAILDDIGARLYGPMPQAQQCEQSMQSLVDLANEINREIGQAHETVGRIRERL